VEFNPNGATPNNGNLIGLPYNEDNAKIVLLPIPWDVTVSYSDGTALGPEAIRDASYQLDLYDADVEDAWKIGLYFRPSDAQVLAKSETYRAKAIQYIAYLEEGNDVKDSAEMLQILAEINAACTELKAWVKQETTALLDAGKLVGLVGGDHSTPLGYLEALAERHNDFGILHIDAHFDLRDAYEGFTYSHASIFYNALKLPQVSRLVSVGIRDYCEAEVGVVAHEAPRCSVFYDASLRRAQYDGESFKSVCERIIAELPQKVYISFDIDGLDPKLCPNTGTPVAGGLEYQEAVYLLKKVVDSGRTIIGFDLSEVGNSEWDGNVGARMLYKMANLMAASV